MRRRWYIESNCLFLAGATNLREANFPKHEGLTKKDISVKLDD